MKILVTIANYGTKNQHYLDQLLAVYRAMPSQVSIVVLSNIPKVLGSDVVVRVGLPSSNPWSLPFAHRQLFLERLEDFDYFIYSEDDTLLTWDVIQAFIKATKALPDNEIAGFVRTERGHDGTSYYSTCHSFFRWVPSSIRERGGHLWARYSNEHAACYILSQAQLRRAIASGGFSTLPHEGRHDMLCAAATDVYTQCDLERLVCIDKLNDFTLPHLPNQYIGKMGLPSEEMGWQVDALRRIYKGELPAYELMIPETRLPGGVGSKFYRELPDPVISKLLCESPSRVLVWGAGDGVFEADLKNQGQDVSVVPLDAVVGGSCRKRGLRLLPPDYLEQPRGNEYFDVIILRDVLHLQDDPEDLLVKIRGLLGERGKLVARIPNLCDIRMLKRRIRDPRFKLAWTKSSLGATPFTPRALRKVVRDAGFNYIDFQAEVPAKLARVNSLSLGLFSMALSPFLYLSARVDKL